MKRIWVIVCLLLILCSCGKPEETNRICPAQLEQETETILNVTSPDAMFFDYKVDSSIKSFELNLWKLEGESWERNGSVHGNLSAQQGRIGINYHEDTFEMIEFTESGSTKSSYNVEGDFTETQMIGTSRLTNETAISPEQEVVLWVKAGTEKNGLSMVLDDFRSLDCDAGLAVTITFSTQLVE